MSPVPGPRAQGESADALRHTACPAVEVETPSRTDREDLHNAWLHQAACFRGLFEEHGPTIGANLAIAVTPHFFIVPDVRYDYGSIGDEINNSLRASIRVLWRF